MIDLTEQLKAGKLPAGAYYVFLATGEIFPDSYNPYGYFEQFDGLVEEVLAPVPSYKEWQENQKSLKVLAEAYCKEKEENQQRKELFKECQYMILAYSINHDTFTKEKVIDTVKQIDNAIGEKK